MPLPDEVIIKFSNWKIVWFIAMVGVFISGIVSLIEGGSMIKYVMALVCIAIGSVSAYVEYWDMLIINQPQLIISSRGITANDGEFYGWDDIVNEKIMPLGSIKPAWFLWFETRGRNRKLHLGGLEKRPEEIMELISHYRAANKQPR
ncbi:hypothetical protein [Mucilaginibacter sp.]|uniref:hypothetical protein n=1 Tax=Mucilaginibacter sp. TaxID=1882438 RepID=UPI0035BC1FE6